MVLDQWLDLAHVAGDLLVVGMPLNADVGIEHHQAPPPHACNREVAVGCLSCVRKGALTA